MVHFVLCCLKCGVRPAVARMKGYAIFTAYQYQLVVNQRRKCYRSYAVVAIPKYTLVTVCSQMRNWRVRSLVWKCRPWPSISRESLRDILLARSSRCIMEGVKERREGQISINLQFIYL